jgi:uroporphyrin-III C-methyltransferase / precorrin-2 dehydrogenase / sirohydrochlorin ferrochelatase
LTFPVFLDLAGRRCLVLGSGAEAKRKMAMLARAGASVERTLPATLDGIALVIVAEVTPETALLARQSRERAIPVNVVDRPELCSFFMPAIVERGPLTIAIGTEGTAPALAKGLRQAFERLLPQQLGELAALAGRLRPLVRLRLAEPEARNNFWREFFEGPLALWRGAAAQAITEARRVGATRTRTDYFFGFFAGLRSRTSVFMRTSLRRRLASSFPVSK